MVCFRFLDLQPFQLFQCHISKEDLKNDFTGYHIEAADRGN